MIKNLDPILFTLFLITTFIFFVIYLDDIKLSNFLTSKTGIQFKNNLSEKTNLFVIFFVQFVFVVVYQGQYLSYETIDSDIHTYLLVGNDVLNGNLPYENEWDDKGPLLYIFYSVLIFISNKNLVIFKILCDAIVLIIAFIIANISLIINKTNKISQALINSILFITLLSPPWGSVEYSEIFALLFLSFSIFIFLKHKKNLGSVFASGIVFGIATLTNQGSGVFFFLFLFLIYQSKKLAHLNLFILGISFPHVIMLGLYASRNLLDVYFSTLFFIPINYSSQSFDFVYEFSVYLRETLYYDPFLYSIIILLFVISIFKLIQFKNLSFYEFIPYIGIFLSLIFFFLGSTGYKHHLIFFLFFLSLIPVSLSGSKKSFQWILVLFILFSFLFFGHKSIHKSLYNFYNLDEIYANYPLRQLAQEIENEFEFEFNIFALDHNLVLFYLDLENEGYIIHPTNYLEPSIINQLIKVDKILENELSYQISQKPNVVICSQEIRWLIEEVNCEVTDFYKGYRKINTDKYFENNSRTFYDDPYRTIDLYINNQK